MSNTAEAVEVKILDKKFLVACPPGERNSLMGAADYLSEKMREIRNSGKVIGSDRIAIMAALNIAHEMLSGKSLDTPENNEIIEKIKALNSTIDSALD